MFRLLSCLLLAASLHAENFMFSRMDGTLWQGDSLTPQLSYEIGTGDRLGSRLLTFDNHVYYLDVKSDTLMRDYQEVGPLTWYDNKVWDVQLYHGFAISADGTGWIASQDSEDGMNSFLLKLDLVTASVIPLGTIGPVGGSSSPVDGMTIIPEPPCIVLLVVPLLILRKLVAN